MRKFLKPVGVIVGSFVAFFGMLFGGGTYMKTPPKPPKPVASVVEPVKPAKAVQPAAKKPVVKKPVKKRKTKKRKPAKVEYVRVS